MSACDPGRTPGLNGFEALCFVFFMGSFNGEDIGVYADVDYLRDVVAG